LFTADVQNDATLPSRMHAVVLFSDQRSASPCIDDSLLQVADVEFSLQSKIK